jgi:hypothetical protein
MERILRMAFKKLAEDGVRLIRAIRGSIPFRSYLAANAASSLPSVPFVLVGPRMERVLRMAFKKLAEDGVRLIRAIRGSIPFRSYLAANAASS